jgi:hypothetical protein
MNIWLVLLLAVGGWYAYRWYQGQDAGTQRDFNNEVLHDAARLLAPYFQLSVEDTEDALKQLVSSGDCRAELAPLQKIEYEVVKESADRALRTVFVTVGTGEQASVGSAHRRMGWDSLPEKVKAQFVVHNSDRLVFPLWQRRPVPTQPTA